MGYYVGKPKLFNRDLLFKRIQDILDSSIWTNNGQYVEAAESYLEEYLGAKHVIMVSNATVGLEMALSLYSDPGRVCSLPSFTFVATVLAAKRAGFSIQYHDIDDHYLIDDSNVPIDNVLIPCNLFGNIKTSLNHLGQTVFDNAHALSVCNQDSGQYAGSDCTLSVFSLHSTKVCGVGEGGFITTFEDGIAEYLREFRNFGYIPGSGAREGLLGWVEGTNAKMSEFQAAIALTQLENLQEIIEYYFNIHKEYERLLPDLIKPKNTMFSNFSYVVAELGNRDRIIEELNKSNIFPRSYFTPLHQVPAHYQDVFLPNTERIAKKIMCLPTGLTIQMSDVKFICSKIREAQKNVR